MSIEIKNLSYTYMPGTPFAHEALGDISLKIHDRKITAIIGHTGSGKSTLVQHINGLLLPQTGSVTVDGIEVNKKNLQDIRKKVGLIFQYPEYQLFEETVEADIGYGLKLRGAEPAVIAEKVTEAMRLVGLAEDTKAKSPFDLSGGQKRRAAIAGILVTDPKILVMDEPAAGLDPEGKNDVLSLIKMLNREKGITVVIVSHSMEDMAATADEMIVLNKGSVYSSGTPGEVFEDAEGIRAIGLELPRITIMMNRLREQIPEISNGIYTVDAAYGEIRRILEERSGHTC